MVHAGPEILSVQGMSWVRVNTLSNQRNHARDKAPKSFVPQWPRELRYKMCLLMPLPCVTLILAWETVMTGSLRHPFSVSKPTGLSGWSANQSEYLNSDIFDWSISLVKTILCLFQIASWRTSSSATFDETGTFKAHYPHLVYRQHIKLTIHQADLSGPFENSVACFPP